MSVENGEKPKEGWRQKLRQKLMLIGLGATFLNPQAGMVLFGAALLIP